MAINISSSYRDDSWAKPPSSSRTLQNRTPFTNGTDDRSSKSKSTRNLNLFFLLRMKDMMLSGCSPLDAACCCLLSLVAVRNKVCRHDSKFKSPPSHPLNDRGDDVRGVRAVDWLPELLVNMELDGSQRSVLIMTEMIDIKLLLSIIDV